MVLKRRSTYVSMVSFGEFFLVLQVLLHLLLGGETDTVHALEAVVGLLGEPIGTGVFGQLESLDQLGARQMRPSAQIDELATLVHGHIAALRHLVTDQLDLEWVVGKHLEGSGAINNNSLEPLLLGQDFRNHIFDFRELFAGNVVVAKVAVIVESV